MVSVLRWQHRRSSMKNMFTTMLVLLVMNIGISPISAAEHKQKPKKSTKIQEGCQRSHHSSHRSHRHSDCLQKCCNKVKRIVREINAKQSCQFIIRAEDINGPAPLVLTQPGDYCLEQDVVYIPVGSNPAITFAAPDIHLDLNGKTLSQGNFNQRVIGILVDGQPNASVVNGSIHNFTLNAIRVQNSNTFTIKWTPLSRQFFR